MTACVCSNAGRHAQPLSFSVMQAWPASMACSMLSTPVLCRTHGYMQPRSLHEKPLGSRARHSDEHGYAQPHFWIAFSTVPSMMGVPHKLSTGEDEGAPTSSAWTRTTHTDAVHNRHSRGPLVGFKQLVRTRTQAPIILLGTCRVLIVRGTQ